MIVLAGGDDDGPASQMYCALLRTPRLLLLLLLRGYNKQDRPYKATSLSGARSDCNLLLYETS